MEGIVSPAQAIYWSVPGYILFAVLHLLGVVCFAYIVAKRMVPLVRAQGDVRFDRPVVRLGKVLKFWFAQWKHPRYWFAGTVHILVFAGFILLVTRAFWVLTLGVDDQFVPPGLTGGAGHAVRARDALRVHRRDPLHDRRGGATAGLSAGTIRGAGTLRRDQARGCRVPARAHRRADAGRRGL